jgi:putative restriction endonuclease
MDISLLQNYFHRFSHLHTNVNHNHWIAATQFRAPHKPFLLLSIMDLFAQGSIQYNLIEITPELGDLFAKYWSIVMPADHKGNIALPFFHLRSSDFWHLLPYPGKESTLENIRQVDTLPQLLKLILGASINEDLYQLLQVEEARNALRTTLIQTHFSAEYHAQLLYQGSVNLQSYLYSQELIDKGQGQIKETSGEANKYEENVRDQGFRRAVVRLYNQRCAFCGVRMLTVDGHSAVDAAHIVPWSISHNDNPRNGMALCRLCHWTFDEGLSSVSAKFTILLSAELRTSLNFPGHLLTLENRPILRPEEQKFMPDLESLKYHRHKIFRSS